jgi:hypothetical protein
VVHERLERDEGRLEDEPHAEPPSSSRPIIAEIVDLSDKRVNSEKANVARVIPR